MNEFHWGGKSSENTFGDNVIGASFRFVFTKVSDEKQVIAGSQLVQSQYQAFLSPFVHFGLGRSNNYIESFNSAYSFLPNLNETQQAPILMKTPIIPNS